MVEVRTPDATEREAWDRFIRSTPSGSFLQSWAWGEFQEAAGFHAHRLLLTDDGGSTRAACLLIDRPLLFGERYLYAPWGPVVADNLLPDLERVEELLAALRTWGEHGALSPVSLRIEPRLARVLGLRAALEHGGFTVLGRGVQPRDTLVVDLQGGDDDLLRGMHPKTRYNIRVAMRHGVQVEERTTDEGIATFLTLARAVERRGSFRYHAPAYYETMLRTLAPQKILSVLIASHRGIPLAAALFMAYGDTVTYAHGASTTKHAHVMASFLLHWEALLRAKAAGARQYDFFGIAPAGVAHHPWAGITRFKRGFGGEEEHTLGIADAVFDPVRYRLYSVARGLRGLLHH